MFLAGNLGVGGIPGSNTRHHAAEQAPQHSHTKVSAPQRDEEEGEMKSKQISELTDMVKVLLEEQRALKEKIELQDRKMKDGPGK